MNDLVSDRLRIERNAADGNAAKLGKPQRDRWENSRSSHRFQAFRGKQLIAYRLMFLVPEITDILTCRELDVSLTGGLVSTWESRSSKQLITVSEVPVEVAPSCFLWMLQRSSLEMTTHKGQKSLRFPLAYKTAINPEVRVDGVFYLLEKAVFDHTTFNKVD